MALALSPQAQLRAREFGLPQEQSMQIATEWHACRVLCTKIRQPINKEKDMGKYFIAWLLGVPGIILVLVYLFMH